MPNPYRIIDPELLFVALWQIQVSFNDVVAYFPLVGESEDILPSKQRTTEEVSWMDLKKSLTQLFYPLFAEKSVVDHVIIFPLLKATAFPSP